MKRVIYSLLATFVMMSAPLAVAENVSVEMAKKAAAHYLQHNTTLSRITVDQLTLSHQWYNEQLGLPSMYLFTAPTDGWIIMTATTAFDPVVGYADDNTFDLDNMAPQLEWWLESYNEMVCDWQNADNEKSMAISPKWEELFNESLKGSKSDVVLLSTRWDQGGINGTDYNMLSPVVRDTVCPTGCVATALAQICKYYEYPKQPTGTASYRWRTGGVQLEMNFDTVPPLDYSIMPTKITSGISYEKRYEVSRLAYYIGLSVKMDYDAAGSGAISNNVMPGMKKYMKYSQGTQIYRRSTQDTHFLNSIRRELMMNRPLYMDGSSSTGGIHAGGHAWVCDGYKENDSVMYHMNWGWNGTGNAFYNLALNNMAISGMGYNFKNNQMVIIGMLPPQDSTSRQIGVQEVENTVTLGLAYPNPATLSVVLPYSTREAADLNVYSISGRLVESRHLQMGEGEVTLRVDALPAGIYIYRMGNAHGKFVVR